VVFLEPRCLGWTNLLGLGVWSLSRSVITRDLIKVRVLRGTVRTLRSVLWGVRTLIRSWVITDFDKVTSYHGSSSFFREKSFLVNVSVEEGRFSVNRWENIIDVTHEETEGDQQRYRAWTVKRDRAWTDNTTIIDTNHEETEGDQQRHRTWVVKRKRYLIRYPTKSQSSVDTPLSHQIQNSVDVPLPHPCHVSKILEEGWSLQS